jgi:hypothetical protein
MRMLAAMLLIAALAACGCANNELMDLRRKASRLESTIAEKDKQLENQKDAIDELHKQLAVARGISGEDVKLLFYPEKIEIESLSGGFDNDGKPGDDGVAVYLRPIDRKGDVIKACGDVKIELYDLAEPPGQFIGEYVVPAAQLIDLWYGKLLTNHYTIKCPWPSGPPKHEEITIKVAFVDLLAKRVVTNQATCKVKLPP